MTDSIKCCTALPSPTPVFPLAGAVSHGSGSVWMSCSLGFREHQAPSSLATRWGYNSLGVHQIPDLGILGFTTMYIVIGSNGAEVRHRHFYQSRRVGNPAALWWTAICMQCVYLSDYFSCSPASRVWISSSQVACACLFNEHVCVCIHTNINKYIYIYVFNI